MALPVDAGIGSVTIDGGAGAAPILKVVDYNPKGAVKTTEAGPWVGEPVIVDVGSALKEECEFTFDVPVGGDATGQDLAILAVTTGLHYPLVFTADTGKIFTYAEPTYKSYDVKATAAGGQQFKLSISGECAISQDV
jgi:hypothetical protein